MFFVKNFGDSSSSPKSPEVRVTANNSCTLPTVPPQPATTLPAPRASTAEPRPAPPSTQLPPPPQSTMAEHTKSISRLLQHSILQLCNEHVGYSHKLQILGVLCMTVDDEQQELVVKVNNTLKRVNPPVMPSKDGPPVLQPAVAPIPPPYSSNLSSLISQYSSHAEARTASPPSQSLPANTAAQTNSRKSHGRKGSHPVKVQHVFDEGELISSEDDQDVLTVIPTDPEASTYDTIRPSSTPASTPKHTPKRKSPYDDNDKPDPGHGAISAVRALLLGRGVHKDGFGAQDLSTTRSAAKSPSHTGLSLPVLMPEGKSRGESGMDTADTPPADNTHDDADDTHARITSPSAYDSPLTIKEEPSDDFSYSTGYNNNNNNNNNNSSSTGSSFEEDISQQLASFAQPNGVISSPAITQLLARTSDGLPTQVPYTLAFSSSTPNKHHDGLSIQYTSTGPITVGENGKNVSRPVPGKSAKVKDIILYDDSSPLHEQRGNRIETDYMLDSFGFEGRKRRRRNQDETLTAEEIAEYLGSMELGGNHSFTCKYCSEELQNLTQYLQHTLTMHHCYICHQCGKSFTTKSSLLRHRPIHTGMRRFACSICKKTFYRKDKCKAHIKRHLGEGGAKPEVEHCEQIDSSPSCLETVTMASTC